MSDPFIDPVLIAPGVNDARSRAVVGAFGKALSEFSTSRLIVQDAWSAPAALLPTMTIEAGLSEFVSPGLREDLLRALIDAAPEIHAQTGLVSGTRRALTALGIDVEWKQWFQQEPRGHHNTHKVTAFLGDGLIEGEDALFSAATRTAIHRVIQASQRWSQQIELAVGFRGGFEDEIELDDETTLTVSHAPIDLYPCGLRYDGTTCHDHAAPILHNAAMPHDANADHRGWRHRLAAEAAGRLMRRPHDGAVLHNAAIDHSGWQADRWEGFGALHDNERVTMTAGVSHSAEDRAGVVLLHDGIARHEAAFNHGSDQPSIADAQMPIIVSRHLLHDGSYRHAGDLHDGEIAHDGAHDHFTGIFHAGSVQQHLTA